MAHSQKAYVVLPECQAAPENCICTTSPIFYLLFLHVHIRTQLLFFNVSGEINIFSAVTWIVFF